MSVLRNAVFTLLLLAPVIEGDAAAEKSSGRYEPTRAEIAAGVSPIRQEYPAGDVRRYGARVDGVGDDTKAYDASLRQAYLNGADPVWPGGTALVSRLSITAPVHIRTRGYATTLAQKAGQPADTPVLRVLASDVEIEPLSIVGNIRSDREEHNHAISVGGTVDVARVMLHGIRARDIRGDALYIGGTSAHPVYDVHAIAVDGTNIYRSVVSITGGVRIRIDSIIGSKVGYRHLDIEPNAHGSQPPDGIEIGYVRGADIQIVGDASTPVGSVDIKYADLDNSLVANSSPGYPFFPRSTGFAAIVANVRDLHFGHLRTRGFPKQAIHCPRAAHKSALRIDVLNADAEQPKLITTEGLRSLDIREREQPAAR